MPEYEVGDVIIFTKLLDGGVPLRCACGKVWRAVEARETCPGCGRGRWHGERVDVEEYKRERKGGVTEEK